MDTISPGNEAQNAQSRQPEQPVQPAQPPTEDNRQQAIEEEQDTARLRSERKSVEDGSGNNTEA